jgi:hypothetical protein
MQGHDGRDVQMNMNRLINYGMRMLMRRGIDAGIDVASRKGKHPENMTAEERQAAKSTRQNTQSARRGLRFMRRFMR